MLNSPCSVIPVMWAFFIGSDWAQAMAVSPDLDITEIEKIPPFPFGKGGDAGQSICLNTIVPSLTGAKDITGPLNF